MFERLGASNSGGGNRRFLAACQDLLELPIVSVDVGADGGVREWGELADIKRRLPPPPVDAPNPSNMKNSVCFSVGWKNILLWI